MRIYSVLLLVVSVVGLLSMSCGPAAGPSPTTEGPSSAPAKPAATAALSRWDTVLATARAEGNLIVYTTANPATTQALARAFKDKYGITADFVVGRGEEIVRRITTENSAGLYLGDVIMFGGSTFFYVIKPAGIAGSLDSALMLPEVTDPAQWRGNRLPFLDRDRQLIAFVNQATSNTAVNSDLVKPADIKSFADLVDPKWKGKIVMDDPTVTGSANDFTGVVLVLFGLDKGKEFLQRIVSQEPVILRDRRLEIEWTARGKYAIAIGADLQTFNEFTANGAPLSYLRMSEGGSSLAGGGCLATVKQPGHPNASLIFINWLLTREGQQIFQNNFGTPSARKDVDVSKISPAFIPQPGENLVIHDEEWYLGEATRAPIVKEIFTPLLR